MKQVEIFGQKTMLQGGPMTLLYYQKEFGEDLYQSYVKSFYDVLDVTGVLKITWAMAKTADTSLPNFADWMGSFDPEKFSLLDLGDEGSWTSEVIETFQSELFRNLSSGKTTEEQA